jgi:hypothetical protein
MSARHRRRQGHFQRILAEVGGATFQKVGGRATGQGKGQRSPGKTHRAHANDLDGLDAARGCQRGRGNRQPPPQTSLTNWPSEPERESTCPYFCNTAPSPTHHRPPGQRMSRGSSTQNDRRGINLDQGVGPLERTHDVGHARTRHRGAHGGGRLRGRGPLDDGAAPPQGQVPGTAHASRGGSGGSSFPADPAHVPVSRPVTSPLRRTQRARTLCSPLHRIKEGC